MPETKHRYRSIYGRVFCKWNRVDGKKVYTVEVPANTEAHMILSGIDRVLTAECWSQRDEPFRKSVGIHGRKIRKQKLSGLFFGVRAPKRPKAVEKGRNK